MIIIEASRDLSSLERYLPVFIEQAAGQMSGLDSRRRALRRAAAVNPGRIEQLGSSGARIPHAFELWIAHLGWLERLSGGVAFSLDDLTAEEARGLALFRSERERFWQAHSSCAHCRSVNLRGATFCGGCGADFSAA